MKIPFSALLLLVASLFVLHFINNQSATRVHAQFHHPSSSAATLLVHTEYRRDTSNELRSITSPSDSDNKILQPELPLALAPDNEASPAVDRNGNIGIGYSFGGSPNFP